MGKLTIEFNKPFMTGKELSNIAEAHIKGMLAGDGDFTQKCHVWLESYTGASKALLTNSCTAALEMSAILLNIQPGDEVITATFTYVATAEVIALLKLKPVLVDVLEDSFLIDPEAIRKAITPKTKAIVPVHLFGQTANMDEINKIAKEHNLFVIEDTAQAIGSDYTFEDGTTAKSGTIGDVGCTSFFPSKNLGCYGDGGAMFTNDDELAKKIRMVANHGQTVRYYHDEVGVNSRLDSIQAAILRKKLPHLDRYNSSRRSAAEFYNDAFKDSPKLITPITESNSTHVFHQYTLQLVGVERDAIISFLNERGIPAMIYYPVALHMQKAYKDDRYSEGHFPVTERLVKSVISLPMHSELDNEDLEYISNSVLEYLKN